jgi:hypothetical protein
MATYTGPVLATGNGSTTGPYSFSWGYLEADDVKVYVGGVLKTAGVDYTALPAGPQTSGSINFATAPANLAVIKIDRVTDAAYEAYSGTIQSADLNKTAIHGPYMAEEAKAGLDEALDTYLPQFVYKSTATDAPVGATKLPTPEANKLLAWDSGGVLGNTAFVSGTVALASQLEAEAGVENTKLLTSLRTKQAIDALAVNVRTTEGTLAAGFTLQTGLTAPYVHGTRGALKISKYLTSTSATVNQNTQVAAALVDFFAGSQYTHLDFEGRQIAIAGTVVLPPGNTGIGGVTSKWFRNGRFTALQTVRVVGANSGSLLNVTRSATVNPNVLTVASAAAVLVGDFVFGAGIPGMTYVTAVDTVSTPNTITISKPASTSGTGDIVLIATRTLTNVTRTINSYTLTVADASSVQVGDHVSPLTGIPRETYVLGKDTTVTPHTIRISNPAYSSGTGDLTFIYWPVMFDFSNCANFQNARFWDMEWDCGSLIGAVRTPGVSAADLAAGTTTLKGLLKFDRCRFRTVLGRGVTMPAVTSVEFNNCEGNSAETDKFPNARSSVFANVGGDSKVRGNSFNYFQHAFVTKSAITYIGNHNWQGYAEHAGDLVADVNSRTAQLVMMGRDASSVISDNYIDNSSIEVTDECNANAVPSSPLGWVVLSNNRCVVNPQTNTTAPNFSWLVLRPFSTNRSIGKIIVNNNYFNDVAPGSSPPSTVDRIMRVDTTNGTIDLVTNKPDLICVRNNIEDSVVYKTLTRPTLSVTKAAGAAATSWTFDFTNYFPFGMSVAKVISVVPVGLIDGSSVAQYDMPRVTFSGGIVTLTFPVARAGTISVTADCSLNDI